MKTAFALIAMMAAACLQATDPSVHFTVLKHFAGAASFSHKENYSQAITDMYLAYDKDGKVVAGAALRGFKTYAEVTSLLVMKKDGDKLVVQVADIPDIIKIKDEDKRFSVLNAIKSITGTVYRDASGKETKIDAVSGATRYQSRIFSTFDLMAKKIAETMAENPAWDKQELKP